MLSGWLLPPPPAAAPWPPPPPAPHRREYLSGTPPRSCALARPPAAPGRWRSTPGRPAAIATTLPNLGRRWNTVCDSFLAPRCTLAPRGGAAVTGVGRAAGWAAEACHARAAQDARDSRARGLAAQGLEPLQSHILPEPVQLPFRTARGELTRATPARPSLRARLNRAAVYSEPCRRPKHLPI